MCWTARQSDHIKTQVKTQVHVLILWHVCMQWPSTKSNLDSENCNVSTLPCLEVLAVEWRSRTSAERKGSSDWTLIQGLIFFRISWRYSRTKCLFCLAFHLAIYSMYHLYKHHWKIMCVLLNKRICDLQEQASIFEPWKIFPLSHRIILVGWCGL